MSDRHDDQRIEIFPVDQGKGESLHWEAAVPAIERYAEAGSFREERGSALYFSVQVEP